MKKVLLVAFFAVALNASGCKELKEIKRDMMTEFFAIKANLNTVEDEKMIKQYLGVLKAFSTLIEFYSLQIKHQKCDKEAKTIKDISKN